MTRPRPSQPSQDAARHRAPVATPAIGTLAPVAALMAAIAVGLPGAPLQAQGLQFGPQPTDTAPPQVEAMVDLDLDYTAQHGAWTTECYSGDGTPDLDRCSIFPPLAGADGRLGFLILEDPDGGLLTQIRIGLTEGPIDPLGPIVFAFGEDDEIAVANGFRVVADRLVVIGDAERLGTLGSRMGAPDQGPDATVEITVHRAGGASPAVFTAPLDGFGDAVGALFDHVRATIGIDGDAPTDGGADSADGAAADDASGNGASGNGASGDDGAPVAQDGADDFGQ